VKADFTIAELRVSLVSGSGSGGDYFQQGRGHWVIDSLIANPMSGYATYRDSRASWGINVLGSVVVELVTAEGRTGVATGFGGAPTAWLVKHHFARFVVGQDVRNINRINDQILRASMPYGRTGLPVAAMSVVDLALWDLLGKLRDEPVYYLIGGKIRDEIDFYCTGPDAAAIKGMGF
jgi:L-rhamnonate dehydratase